jgi:ABC-2 type transport system permease protein
MNGSKFLIEKAHHVMIAILLLSAIGLGVLTKTIGETDQNPDWKKELMQENKDMKEQLKGVNNPALEKSYERLTAINEYRIKHDLPEDGDYSALSVHLRREQHHSSPRSVCDHGGCGNRCE